MSTISPPTTVHLGAYTQGVTPGRGITRCRRDPATGALTVVEVAPAADPAYLAWHPGGRMLYAVAEQDGGQVLAFAADAEGGLRPVAVEPTQGKGPCHLAVAADGRHLVVASYASGSVSVHPLAGDGGLQPVSARVAHGGSGPNTTRQEAAHAHHVWFAPDDAHALVTDLGADRVEVHHLDPADGNLTSAGGVDLPPGMGPRHLAAASDGRLFVVGELDAMVATLRWDARTGALAATSAVPAAACEDPPASQPSAIRLSGDERFVYVANRGIDTVGVLAVDGERLSLVQEIPTRGAWPRDLALIGDHVYVANQHSGDVVVFDRDPASGRLTPTGDVLATPAPSCVLATPEG